jgi:hypothetical protein
VVLNSLTEKRQKRDKTRKKTLLDFFVDFLQKLFDTIFLQNVLCSVFELPSLRNTRKRDKTKKVEKRLTSEFCRFVRGRFSTWAFCKNVFVVFLNSSYREMPKNVLRKRSRNKNMCGGSPRGL